MESSERTEIVGDIYKQGQYIFLEQQTNIFVEIFIHIFFEFDLNNKPTFSVVK